MWYSTSQWGIKISGEGNLSQVKSQGIIGKIGQTSTIFHPFAHTWNTKRSLGGAATILWLWGNNEHGHEGLSVKDDRVAYWWHCWATTPALDWLPLPAFFCDMNKPYGYAIYYVSPHLLIVMLSPSNAWGTHPGRYYSQQAPTDISPMTRFITRKS